MLQYVLCLSRDMRFILSPSSICRKTDATRSVPKHPDNSSNVPSRQYHHIAAFGWCDECGLLYSTTLASYSPFGFYLLGLYFGYCTVHFDTTSLYRNDDSGTLDMQEIAVSDFWNAKHLMRLALRSIC